MRSNGVGNSFDPHSMKLLNAQDESGEEKFSA